MKTPLPPVLRAALYRRAVACAWLTVCERQHRYPHLTLESLEAAIAAELEGLEQLAAFAAIAIENAKIVDGSIEPGP